ncbi:MAG: hypothetical protein H6922_05475 [Pseudomonadaceae bacterium]|nr:hypothetical protein [Pseudomonadaceae bacterium]
MMRFIQAHGTGRVNNHILLEQDPAKRQQFQAVYALATTALAQRAEQTGKGGDNVVSLDAWRQAHSR